VQLKKKYKSTPFLLKRQAPRFTRNIAKALNRFAMRNEQDNGDVHKMSCHV
jgi:hypothetical protein